jgi:hypothetical protein
MSVAKPMRQAYGERSLVLGRRVDNAHATAGDPFEQLVFPGEPRGANRRVRERICPRLPMDHPRWFPIVPPATPVAVPRFLRTFRRKEKRCPGLGLLGLS